MKANQPCKGIGEVRNKITKQGVCSRRADDAKPVCFFINISYPVNDQKGKNREGTAEKQPCWRST